MYNTLLNSSCRSGGFVESRLLFSLYGLEREELLETSCAGEQRLVRWRNVDAGCADV